MVSGGCTCYFAAGPRLTRVRAFRLQQVAALKPKHQDAHYSLLKAAAARQAAAKEQSTLAATIAAGVSSPRR